MPHLKQKVMNFKQGMPVISSLRNTALRERHWNEIQEIIGTKVVRDKMFTLGNLLQLKANNLISLLLYCMQKRKQSMVS